jgi:hypothetical protein
MGPGPNGCQCHNLCIAVGANGANVRRAIHADAVCGGRYVTMVGDMSLQPHTSSCTRAVTSWTRSAHPGPLPSDWLLTRPACRLDQSDEGHPDAWLRIPVPTVINEAPCLASIYGPFRYECPGIGCSTHNVPVFRWL